MNKRYFIIGCTYQIKTGFFIFKEYKRIHGTISWVSSTFPNIYKLEEEISKDVFKQFRKKAYNVIILSVNEVSYEDYKTFWNK